MSPKFRGGSDDWMDDEKRSGGRRSGSKPKKPAHVGKARSLPPEEANAIVAEVYPNQCRVRLDESGEDILCSYRRANVIKQSNEDIRERSPVAVGDRVRIERVGKTHGIVDGVCQRASSLARPAPGDEVGKKQHVIAANVDTLVIVSSIDEPEFSPGLVDRFLVAAAFGGIAPILCITKVDKHPAGEIGGIYRDAGYEVHEVSSKTGVGIDELRSRLIDRTVVFCGKSGAGKTSLLRQVLQAEVGKVGDVSAATGKGKHTTTAAVLLGGPGESRWIDTPGVREFGLIGIDPEQLHVYFPEFKALDCERSGCVHSGEPDCQAARLPRHLSYLRILESLRQGEY